MADNDVPRPYTVDEMRARFIEHVQALVDYWASPELDREAVHSRLSGLAHSVLSTLSGCSSALPGFDLVPNPHADDEQLGRDRGENWWTAADINDGELHRWLYNNPDGGPKDWAQREWPSDTLKRAAARGAAARRARRGGQ